MVYVDKLELLEFVPQEEAQSMRETVPPILAAATVNKMRLSVQRKKKKEVRAH